MGNLLAFWVCFGKKYSLCVLVSNLVIQLVLHYTLSASLILLLKVFTSVQKTWRVRGFIFLPLYVYVSLLITWNPQISSSKSEKKQKGIKVNC